MFASGSQDGFHRGLTVQPPGLQTFSPQAPLQYPTSGKRVAEVQFVDPPDQGKAVFCSHALTLPLHGNPPR